MKHLQEFKLSHPVGVEISAILKETDVSALLGINKRDMNNGYVWYYLKSVIISGEAISFNLCFFQGALKEISLVLSNPELYGSGDWNDWSEEKERARAKDTERWLNSMGFNVGSYQWGVIWAGYDLKGARGSAGIRYTL